MVDGRPLGSSIIFASGEKVYYHNEFRQFVTCRARCTCVLILFRLPERSLIQIVRTEAMWLPADGSCPYGWSCPWTSQLVVNRLWMELPPGYRGERVAKGKKGMAVRKSAHVA